MDKHITLVFLGKHVDINIAKFLNTWDPFLCLICTAYGHLVSYYMINIFKKTWWKKDVTNPLEKDSEVPSTNNHFKWKLFNISKGSAGKALSYPTW